MDIRQIVVGIFLLSLVSVSEAQRWQSGISIQDAYYGADTQVCDARREVARYCNGRETCDLRVNNELCGDPARGERKALFVAYSCDGRTQEIALSPEKENITLYCRASPTNRDHYDQPRQGRRGVPPARAQRNALYIDFVDYGIENRVCDATREFSDRCDGRGYCQVRVDNNLCGDPAKGKKKTAFISYWCNGRSYEESVREKDTASLYCN